MYNTLKISIAGIGMLLLLTSCDDCLKSYSNTNTARPTVPDINGRNIGDDGTTDKLIDPFFKGPERTNRELLSAKH